MLIDLPCPDDVEIFPFNVPNGSLEVDFLDEPDTLKRKISMRCFSV